MARSTFKVLFYVNGSKEKNGIVPIMGRVTINGTVAQFSCKRSIPKELWDIRLRAVPFARARHGVTTDKHSRALPPIVPRKDVYPEGTRKSPWIRRVFDISGRSGCAARNWPGRDRSSCHTCALPGVQERSFRFYTFPVRIYRHRQIRDIQSTAHGILHRILCAPGGAVKGGDQQ